MPPEESKHTFNGDVGKANMTPESLRPFYTRDHGERDHFNACGHGLLKVVRALDRKDLSFLEYFYLLGRHSWFGRYVDCERPRGAGSPEEPLVKPIFPSLRPKESRTGPDEGYKPPRISMGDDFGDLKGNVV